MNRARSQAPRVRVLRDFKLWGLLAVGIAFSSAAVSIWRSDVELLSEATETTALVIAKSAGSGDSGNPNRPGIRYQWTDVASEPARTHLGSDAFAGGQAAFEALVPGQSTVVIAWRKTDGGNTIESRLIEQGATGMPWSLLLVGVGMLAAVPIRAWMLYRAEPGASP